MTEDLGAAWAEVIAALPPGAHFFGVQSLVVDSRTGAPAEWRADASKDFGQWEGATIVGRGSSPAAALRNLTHRLQRPENR